MKKLLLILLCVPLMFSCGQENETVEKKNKKSKFILDSKTPANVVNAIFYAARTLCLLDFPIQFFLKSNPTL